MNNIPMEGLSDIKLGMLDSGTTFTYFPTLLFETFIEYFHWFCSVDTSNHCKGKLLNPSKNANDICFAYEESQYPEGPKKYFLTYPVITFRVNGHDLLWYPSEYLYRAKPGKYCMAVEKF